MKLTQSWAPWTTFKQPAGRPASSMSSTNMWPAPGTRSDGFKIKVFPHMRDTGYIQRGIMAGKLNGATPAVTPSGSRYERISKSAVKLWRVSPKKIIVRWNWGGIRLEFGYQISPWIRDGIPQAISTTWRPRWTSPSASAKVLLKITMVIIILSLLFHTLVREWSIWQFLFCVLWWVLDISTWFVDEKELKYFSMIEKLFGMIQQQLPFRTRVELGQEIRLLGWRDFWLRSIRWQQSLFKGHSIYSIICSYHMFTRIDV